MKDNNKKRIPEFLVPILPILCVIIGAMLTLGIIRLTSHWEQVKEKDKISNFVNGCIQNELFRTQREVELIRSFLDGTDINKLSENQFSWQHESVLIQAISDQIGVLDISIVKAFNNHVIRINQNITFRESLSQALIKNDNDISKVKPELNQYASVLEKYIKTCQEIVDLINEK